MTYRSLCCPAFFFSPSCILFLALSVMKHNSDCLCYLATQQQIWMNKLLSLKEKKTIWWASQFEPNADCDGFLLLLLILLTAGKKETNLSQVLWINCDNLLMGCVLSLITQDTCNTQSFIVLCQWKAVRAFMRAWHVS